MGRREDWFWWNHCSCTKVLDCWGAGEEKKEDRKIEFRQNQDFRKGEKYECSEISLAICY